MSAKVIKRWVDKEKGISLFFTQNEKGLYMPSSNSDVITNWLLYETKKPGQITPVDEDNIFRVVNAAKDRLAHPEKYQKKQAERQESNSQLWKDNPVNALQEYFQSAEHRVLGGDGQPVLPKYKTVDVMQGNGQQTVTIVLMLPTGEEKYASAGSAQEAKRMAAIEYARDVLGVFGETKSKAYDAVVDEAPKSNTTKTKAPRGYYQLGEVFSVDGDGNAHRLPRTEYQLFLGPDVWMGRVGKKYTMFRHNEPLASFEWGKSLISGGGTFYEEKFRSAKGTEISREEFFDIMCPIIESQDQDVSYALYRGKPGTPLEEARRYSFLRPATVEEFCNSVDGFIEYYKLEEKIRAAEKRTRGTHGGNYEMLYGKVLDLEEEQSDIDGQILENKKLFCRKPRGEREDDRRSNPEYNPMAAAMQKALGNKR